MRSDFSHEGRSLLCRRPTTATAVRAARLGNERLVQVDFDFASGGSSGMLRWGGTHNCTVCCDATTTVVELHRNGEANQSVWDTQLAMPQELVDDDSDSQKMAAVLLVTTGGQPGDVVRYAWSNWPECVLFDQRDLPVGPFELTLKSDDDHQRDRQRPAPVLPSPSAAAAAVKIQTSSPPLATTAATYIGLNLDWWANNATNNENMTGLWQDASLLVLDLTNPRLTAAVKAFGGRAIIRMGGTLGDEIGYDVGGMEHVRNCPTPHAASDGNVSYCLSMARWDALHSWCARAGCRIAFGLNALYGRAGNPRHSFKVSGPWDFSNTEALLKYTAGKGYNRNNTLFGFELGKTSIANHFHSLPSSASTVRYMVGRCLKHTPDIWPMATAGNELQDDLPAKTLAAQYKRLGRMLNMLWPGDRDASHRPWIIGPDENPDGKWLDQFLQASGGVVQAVTYHQYSGFGGDANLSAQLLTPTYWHNPVHTLIWNGTSVEPPVRPHSAPSILQAFERYKQSMAPTAELWVGETAAAWDSGKRDECIRRQFLVRNPARQPRPARSRDAVPTVVGRWCV